MHCPVCRADNDQRPQCRRCRADLGMVFALVAQRRRALGAAYRCVAHGDVARARAIASGARALLDDAEVRRLEAVCSLVGRDFATAWRDYGQCIS